MNSDSDLSVCTAGNSHLISSSSINDITLFIKLFNINCALTGAVGKYVTRDKSWTASAHSANSQRAALRTQPMFPPEEVPDS